MVVYSVFLDIDGTLITDKDGPFEDDLAGIEKAWRQGVKFFLCTGRSMIQIAEVFLKAPWLEGIIAAGGAHVILNGNVLYHKWIPLEVLDEAAALFLAAGKRCNFRGDKQIYAVNQEGGRLPVTSPGDFVKKYSDAKVSMLTVDLTMEKKERSFLEKHFDIYPQIPHFDCFIKGEGKAKGMKLIMDTLALERNNSIAIGDSANDMDIIEYAGKGIAVGNACKELKEKAAWISTPVGEGAVVKALEYLDLC